MFKKSESSKSVSSKFKEEVKELKVILLGETGVGKTNIINKYIKGDFVKDSTPTIGSTFGEKNIKREGCIYSLKVWDTTGQEKYNSITKLFVRDSNIVVLVYAIDNLASFEKIKFWYNYINQELKKNTYVLGILGNKRDLIDYEVVSEDDGKKIAKEKNAIFGLVSAKIDKQQISDFFEALLDEFINKKLDQYLNDTSIRIEGEGENNENNRTKKCC